ncbi:hypothetical protein E0K97_00185 [Lactobacillus agilis]|uniref:hypothetical protein n=1 Tax=Ligilactobacillus agilis TaxID=1601 RepID=UPI001430C0EC|nr:hypothetical protein [Ligilactobacillus agilis]NJE31531.1 hypothetical protein [Ligilactobacillus agilis]
MMVIKRKTVDNVSIFLMFFFLTLGNSQFFVELGSNNLLIYLGYSIILLKVLYILKNNINFASVKRIIIFSVLAVLFNVGIILQKNLLTSTKLNLIFSMLLIALIAVFSEGILNDTKQFVFISYAILWACMIATLLALVKGISITSLAVEGGLGSNYGFTGGLQHKNYFGVAALAGYISAYISDKNRNLLWIYVILIVVSNARTAYILFLIFLMISNVTKITKIRMTKLQLRLIIIAISILVMVSLFVIYKKITSGSESYQYRYQGLINYLNMYGKDKFYMLFGNAEMAFRNSGQSYTYNIRSVTGWDGTTELALLSILVKNGLIGMMGYIIIFTYRLIQILSMNFSQIKYNVLAIWVIFLTSGFVETYVANINLVFSPFCYIAIGSLYSIYMKNKPNAEMQLEIKENRYR